MVYKIIFTRNSNGYTIDPLVDNIRKEARQEKWTGINGLKQWAKETYNAILRTGPHDDWTSITFKTELDFTRFKQRFELIK